MNLISTVQKVIRIKQGADGTQVDWVTDGEDGASPASESSVLSLKFPAKTIAQKLYLADGRWVVLPFTDFAWILPDRTGVVVIFKQGSYVHPDGSDVFALPNNAAIFNADGTLRFQLKVPQDAVTHRIAAMHSGAMLGNYKDMMGVIIASHPEAEPEWVYAIDLNSPELIRTGQWVRY